MGDSFGKLFSELLEKNNKSQEEISEQFGVSPSYVSKIIKGKKLPTLDFLKKMIFLLKMKPEKALTLFDTAASKMDCFSDIEKKEANKPKNNRDPVKNKMLACVLLMLLSDELVSGPYVSSHEFSDYNLEVAKKITEKLEQLAKEEFSEKRKQHCLT